jgi:hypothetical protein
LRTSPIPSARICRRRRAVDAWRRPAPPFDTEQSQGVGDTHTQGGSGRESTGHKSGRRIVSLKRTKKADLTDGDYQHMNKVVGYVHRHLAQHPSGDIEDSNWRYSLMNWGHEPLKG